MTLLPLATLARCPGGGGRLDCKFVRHRYTRYWSQWTVRQSCACHGLLRAVDIDDLTPADGLPPPGWGKHWPMAGSAWS